jgi:hypothetical protein
LLLVLGIFYSNLNYFIEEKIMTKIVIALCLFLNGELKEHRVQQTMSECLKHKRIASRNMDMTNKQYVCGEVKAIMDKNVDGSFSIRKIIIESK